MGRWASGTWSLCEEVGCEGGDDHVPFDFTREGRPRTFRFSGSHLPLFVTKDRQLAATPLCMTIENLLPVHRSQSAKNCSSIDQTSTSTFGFALNILGVHDNANGIIEASRSHLTIAVHALSHVQGIPFPPASFPCLPSKTCFLQQLKDSGSMASIKPSSLLLALPDGKSVTSVERLLAPRGSKCPSPSNVTSDSPGARDTSQGRSECL